MVGSAEDIPEVIPGNGYSKPEVIPAVPGSVCQNDHENQYQEYYQKYVPDNKTYEPFKK